MGTGQKSNTKPTVVCVYKPGNGFSDEYVVRLKESVAANCKADHDFVCLTNRSIAGVTTIPLQQNRIGYWNKLEIFRRGLFNGPVIYLDLDTIVVSDVTDIVTANHNFTAADNFKATHSGVVMASWFMAFDGLIDRQYLFDGFTPKTPAEYETDWRRWGDQGYIQDTLNEPWTPLDPYRYESYKWSVRPNGRIDSATSFVVFHGRPRIAEVNWRLPNGKHRDKQ